MSEKMEIEIPPGITLISQVDPPDPYDESPMTWWNPSGTMKLMQIVSGDVCPTCHRPGPLRWAERVGGLAALEKKDG